MTVWQAVLIKPTNRTTTFRRITGSKLEVMDSMLKLIGAGFQIFVRPMAKKPVRQHVIVT